MHLGSRGARIRGVTPATSRRTQPGLLSNAAALVGSRLVVAVLGWAGTVLIVRRLSVEDFGRFSFVFGLLGLLHFLTDFGSGRVVVGRLADPATDRASFAGTYVVLRAALGLLGYGVAVAVVLLGGYPHEVVQATLLAGLVVLVAAPSSGLDAVFQVDLRLGVVAVGTVLGQIAQLALTVAVALVHPTLLLFLLPALAYDLVLMAWKARALRRSLRLRLRVDLAVWGAVLRQAAPIALAGALATLYQKVDLVMLSQLDGFDAVARYSVADKFVTVAAFLPTALTAPLLTVLVRAWPHDAPAFRAAVSRGMLLLAVAAGAVLVGFLPFAPDLIRTLYGASYVETATAARLSVTAECLGFVAFVAVSALIAVSRNAAYVWVTLLGLVVNVAANVVLIPRYSYEGAAVATFVTTSCVSVALLVLVARVPGAARLPLLRLLGVLLCALLGVLVGGLLEPHVPWPLGAGLAVLVYLACVELSRATGPRGLRSLLTDGAEAPTTTGPRA